MKDETHTSKEEERLREKFRCNLAVLIDRVVGGLLGYAKVKNIEDEIMRVFDEVSQEAITQEREKFKKYIEELPAFTPCSDKTMSEVSYEAKKPRWGTNYLERETILQELNNQ